jgi:hypothetical protein
MRIEVNPLSAEVSAICIPSSGHVKVHLSRAPKIKSRVYLCSLDRGQAGRFSKRDVIAAFPVALLGVPTFLFPQLTKSVILCFFRRPKDVKVVGSEAGVIAETVHACWEEINETERNLMEKVNQSWIKRGLLLW